MKALIKLLVRVFLLVDFIPLNAEDGYRLWLRYDLVSNPEILEYYRETITGYMISDDSPTCKVAETELQNALTDC
jgi:alpha-glucuronidase